MLKVKCLVGTAKTKEGKPFKTFKVITQDGEKVDCRFTQDCQNIPSASAYLYVKENNINRDTRKLYPCFWIKNVEKVEELTFESNVDKYFEKVE